MRHPAILSCQGLSRLGQAISTDSSSLKRNMFLPGPPCLHPVIAKFNVLQEAWKNAALPVKWKLELFDACVISALKYGTACALLSKGDLRRLDGFEANCLRKILGIKPSMISRISNDRVHELAGVRPLSMTIHRRQVKLLGEILTNPDKRILRNAAFQPGTKRPWTDA